jgi:SAM-dependent methyltransferase
MIRYYDKTNHQLVYVNQKADPQFWDEQWSTNNFVKAIKGPKNRFTVRFTTKYLKRGARLLEGGCGRGDKVYALHRQGYDVYGVDYASKTVQQINEYTPELKVSLGDVRNLQFDNDFFDGYWSFGVIEHFYDGYFPILKEMHRVLKNGGYLFLTTPSMSLLRSIKAKLGCYPKFQETDDIKQNFYQFALNSKSVTYNFERIGFQLIEMKFYGGNIGIQQDANLCEPIFNPVCENRFSGSAISLLTSQFANHMTLYIFKKNG